jgi:hypothetical protein
MPLIMEFTGESEDAITSKAAKARSVQESWAKDHPTTPVELRDYYGASDNGYLYDLLAWNTSQDYYRITRLLNDYRGEKALVVGPGLGTEAAMLAGRNEVEVFELPGILKKFSKKRLGSSVTFLDGNTLDQALEYQLYTLIVAIDVLEHIHPDEIESMLELIYLHLAEGGTLYLHNAWGEQDKYPMHFDHSEIFNKFCEKHQIIQETLVTWRKRSQ